MISSWCSYSRPRIAPRLVRNRLRLDDVLAVERQRRVREHAADRADRQPLDVPVLRRVLADAERLARHAALGIADGERADLAGGRQVALEQHGDTPSTSATLSKP